MQYSLEIHNKVKIVCLIRILTIQWYNLSTAMSSSTIGPNISKWLEKQHFNPVSILAYCTVLENTHLFQVGGSGSTY